MACCLLTEDDSKSIVSDYEQIDDPILVKSISQLREEAKTNTKYNLHRGGCVIKTIVGPIQFGIPPETVKDSLNIG